jgi:hypothetical protein
MTPSSSTLTTFVSPLCSRKGPHGSIDSEGFFFVDDGMIVVHHELNRIGIFENADTIKNVPVLEVNLQVATRITFKKIRSSSSTFEGGRVRITGIFDRVMKTLLLLKCTQKNTNILVHYFVKLVFKLIQFDPFDSISMLRIQLTTKVTTYTMTLFY